MSIGFSLRVASHDMSGLVARNLSGFMLNLPWEVKREADRAAAGDPEDDVHPVGDSHLAAHLFDRGIELRLLERKAMYFDFFTT
jgi:hypothetical protein